MTKAMLKLDSRAVIRLSGPEARTFLQGLVTNDVLKVADGTAVYAAMLTPQGKYMFDMILMADGDDLLVDTEAARKDDLLRRLMMYKLRADVTIANEDSLAVWVALEKPDAVGIMAPDPRHSDLGWRLIASDTPDAPSLDMQTYEEARLSLGVPDGSRDMMVEKYFWLETAAERLNGVSFTKGCFVGQELTARMKHRTSLKKMLLPVRIEGGAPDAGTKLETTDGKTAGELRSGAGDFALAYLKLEHAEGPLVADGRDVVALST